LSSISTSATHCSDVVGVLHPRSETPASLSSVTPAVDLARWRIEILSYGTTRTWNYALLE
jgi:hypothetical protein